MAVRKPKEDPAHAETEKIILEMEKRLAKEYAVAERDVQAKIDDYFDRFRLKDQKWREWVKDGTKTKQEYQQWRIGQMAVGKRWENMKETIAEDYHHANDIARSIVRGYLPEVYATNFNYGTYEAEIGAKIDTSFTLYSRESVERIMRDDPKLLPDPGRKKKAEIAAGKDIAWNRQQVQSVMIQGILQGESIPKLANRLAKEVGERDHRAAIRNARTMATSAQNAGRVDAYKRAESMGIDMVQEWRATLDMRTRHEHRIIDGERQPVGEKFSNGCKYPGDPSGSPNEIYNCRCTLRGVVKGLEPQARKMRDESAIEGMTYDEWKASKVEKPNPITLPEEKGEAIAESYRAQYRGQRFGNKPNDDQSKKTENYVTRTMKADKVEYIQPKSLQEVLTDEQIIQKVGGGDMTKGSCVSSALAYAGNRCGYDVLDFRGGISRDKFAHSIIMKNIASFDGVNGITVKNTNDFKAVSELLKSVNENSEYILGTGKHCAIIRKMDNKFEYLELQTPNANGWKSLNNSELKTRFGCAKTHTLFGTKVEEASALIDIDSLKKSDDFTAILGYLNTNADKQQKGKGGWAK